MEKNGEERRKERHLERRGRERTRKVSSPNVVGWEHRRGRGEVVRREERVRVRREGRGWRRESRRRRRERRGSSG